MVKYLTETFDLNDDDMLWEKFRCFMRQIIPWEEKQLKMLSETQKEPVIAFIFINETMRQGLTGFFDLFAKDIKNSDIINAFKALSISDKYIKVIEEMPAEYVDPWDKYGENLSEEEFEAEVERLDAYYDKYYKLLIKYDNEDKEIYKKIVDFVRQYHLEFFEYK